MAKKSRRVRRKGKRPRLSDAQLVQPTETAIQKAVADVTPKQEKEAGEPARQSVATDFRSEYQYVVRDLQRIGILAAAMLGGLLILSFIL
jgi:hypothetical protein